MDGKVQRLKPDYQRIYSDIIRMRFPHKAGECEALLKKKELSVLDVLKLNKKIFEEGSKWKPSRQRHRSYGRLDIVQILNHQKKHQLSNMALATHFGLSRNTVAKWKKLSLPELK